MYRIVCEARNRYIAREKFTFKAIIKPFMTNLFLSNNFVSFF